MPRPGGQTGSKAGGQTGSQTGGSESWAYGRHESGPSVGKTAEINFQSSDGADAF